MRSGLRGSIFACEILFNECMGDSCCWVLHTQQPLALLVGHTQGRRPPNQSSPSVPTSTCLDAAGLPQSQVSRPSLISLGNPASGISSGVRRTPRRPLKMACGNFSCCIRSPWVGLWLRWAVVLVAGHPYWGGGQTPSPPHAAISWGEGREPRVRSNPSSLKTLQLAWRCEMKGFPVSSSLPWTLPSSPLP